MQQNDAENGSERGSSRNVLIGVLAVLVALFGYLYFFTGVIKQRGEVPQTIPAPQQLVKQPIPPRLGSSAPPKAAEAPAKAPNAAPPQTAQPLPVPAKPPLPAAKPTAPQPKQEPAASKPAQAKDVQPAPQPKKPAVVPPKPTTTAQKQAPAPKVAAVKPEAVKTPAKVPQQKDTANKPVVAHRILTTEIVSMQKADRIVEQLKKAGLGSVRKESRLSAHSMNRLLVTEFADRAAAVVELEKLRRSAPGAFILPSNGKYELYAGSYDKEKGAESEKKRLESQGVKSTLQKAEVKVSTYHVTAQAKSKEMADESLRIIRKLGADATAARTGK